MPSYVWYCIRCSRIRVDNEDEMCDECQEDVFDGGEDEPVDKRMKHGFSKRIAEGSTKDY